MGKKIRKEATSIYLFIPIEAEYLMEWIESPE